MSRWTPERVHEAFRERFPDLGLVVLANRQPYAHEREDGGIVVRRPAGGMALALDPILRAVGGTWVAWGDGEADRDVVDENDRVEVPPEDPAYRIRRIWLTASRLMWMSYASRTSRSRSDTFVPV